MGPPRFSRSVTRCASCADTRLGANLLGKIACAVFFRTGLLSRIENSQMPTKPAVIENSAGEV